MTTAERYDDLAAGAFLCPLFDGVRLGLSALSLHGMGPGDWLSLGVMLAHMDRLWAAMSPAERAARLADDGRPVYATMSELAFGAAGVERPPGPDFSNN